MTAPPKKAPINYWLILPGVLVVAAYFAAWPWLERTLAAGLGVAIGIFVMGYALFLSLRFERHVDEVEAAGAAFGQKWGVIAGTMTFAVLLMLPPFTDIVAGIFGGDPERRAIVDDAMRVAFGGTVLLQTIGFIVANLLWWRARR